MSSIFLIQEDLYDSIIESLEWALKNLPTTYFSDTDAVEKHHDAIDVLTTLKKYRNAE